MGYFTVPTNGVSVLFHVVCQPVTEPVMKSYTNHSQLIALVNNTTQSQLLHKMYDIGAQLNCIFPHNINFHVLDVV